jgi:prolyl-tRNA synthetase
MRISRQLFQDHFQIPDNWASMPTYKLMEKVGLVAFFQAGFPTFLPIGQRVVNAVNCLIREEVVRGGFDEIYLPLVQDVALLQKTGRADQFDNEFFRLLNHNLILTPTNEEVYSYLASRTDISYRQLPIRIFQIADKFRNVSRSKGIFRTKEFLMCDMVSIDPDERMLRKSAAGFEQIAKVVFRRLDVEPIRIEKNNGRYVDFVIECPEGNTFIAHNPDRFESGGIPASSIGMYFLFDQTGPEYRKSNNDFGTSCLGSYGFGIQRCMHAVIEQHRDNLGINFPVSVRPFDSSVIVLDPSDQLQMELAEECYVNLLALGAKPFFDDRSNKNLKEKAVLADYFGIPFKLIIGRREAVSKVLTLKWRNGREQQARLDPETLLKLLNI